MTRANRIACNAVTAAVLLVSWLLTFLVFTPARAAAMQGMALLVLPLGRFVILAPVFDPAVPFSPVLLAIVVVLVETCITVTVVANLKILLRVPFIGERLRRIEANGRALLDARPRLRRAAEVGVALFVSLPVPGTGAIGGALVGRLCGLSPLRSVLTVVAGTILGASILTVAAHLAARALEPILSSPWFGVARPVIIAGIVALIVWLGRPRKAMKASE